jgi:5-methylthioadenosine/S-adenosylhomocysteine deaminase
MSRTRQIPDESRRFADLLIVEKDRIMFPPGRYETESFLDVVLDRTDAGDIDTVIAHGRVLMEGRRVTIVDEDAVKARFAEAVTRRMYRFPEHVQRWGELGRLVEPYVIDFYQRWYDTPVEPAYLYNPRTPPV